MKSAPQAEEDNDDIVGAHVEDSDDEEEQQQHVPIVDNVPVSETKEEPGTENEQIQPATAAESKKKKIVRKKE